MRFIASAAYVALAMLMSMSAGRTHDIYSHLKDNRGVPCCNDTDCRPARFFRACPLSRPPHQPSHEGSAAGRRAADGEGRSAPFPVSWARRSQPFSARRAPR